MSRTAILPTTGDPYTCKAFLACYKKYWKNEVDTLRVYINAEMSDDLLEYVVGIFEEEGAIVQCERARAGHGKPLDVLVSECTEDYIYITEDDFFVFEPGVVDRWFRTVEEGAYDAVGSMRGCCSLEMCDRIAARFRLSDKLIQQPNFWPCLYVGTKESLQQVQRGFGPKNWKANEVIPELGYTVPASTGGDTFVSASIELRAQGLRFFQEDQHRIIDVFIRRDTDPKWIHVGSCANALINLRNGKSGTTQGLR